MDMGAQLSVHRVEAAYRSAREASENAAGPAGLTGLTRAGGAGRGRRIFIPAGRPGAWRRDLATDLLSNVHKL
ncbi:hypothetical protein GCM10023074_28140 [Microbispora amethystogenes]|uniref:Uncharacterized protein n=1 Tax=Microbispora amethystogenes TaxID=1427754 RepID=A0ABQ4F9X7_9ACTN|nr:hypothetical protein Mam01_17610 [Microbispora amethystogenes]